MYMESLENYLKKTLEILWCEFDLKRYYHIHSHKYYFKIMVYSDCRLSQNL